MSFRKEKLASLLMRLAAEYLLRRGVSAGAYANITRIDLSPDFKKALIFVTIEPEEQSEEALRALRKLLPSLRREVAKKLFIKFIPLLEFQIDTGEKKRARIEELIEKLSAENKKQKR